MRDNANTIIEGRLLALVPYKPHHVAVYNTWMQDPYLQDMTASEPLSLEEEYDMQVTERPTRTKRRGVCGHGSKAWQQCGWPAGIGPGRGKAGAGACPSCP